LYFLSWQKILYILKILLILYYWLTQQSENTNTIFKSDPYTRAVDCLIAR